MQALWRVLGRSPQSTRGDNQIQSGHKLFHRMFAHFDHRVQHFRRLGYHGFFLDGMIFAISVGLYLLNTYGLKPVTSQPWIHNHANDFLAMPCILAYSNTLIRICGRPEWKLVNAFRIIALTCACAIVWEGAAPLLISRSVRDPLDLAAYAAGSIVYWGVLNSYRSKKVF